MRKLLVVLVIAMVAATVFFLARKKTPLFVDQTIFTEAPTYKAAGNIKATVSVFDELEQVTQIDITPDGNYMLVGTLPGSVFIYHKVDGTFKRQFDPFFEVKTSHPGFPPQEAGLTGVVLGSDFETSGDVFLNYSFAAEKKSFRNRVTRVAFTKKR